MNKEKIIEKSRFNMSKYLMYCYENNIAPDDDFINQINFQEISSVNISYQDSNGDIISYDIKETLMENLIKFLPFEAYKKYIKPEWLEYYLDYGSSLINIAIIYQNTEFINHLYKITKEEASKNKDFTHSFLRGFIEPILSLKENIRSLNYYKHPDLHEKYLDFIENYHNLIKKCFIDKKLFSEKIYKTESEAENDEYNDKNPLWIKNIIDSYNFYYPETFNNLLCELVERKENTPILLDLLGQMKKIFKNELKDDYADCIGLKDSSLKNVLDVCINKRNLTALDILINHFDIDLKEVLNSFENILLSQWKYIKLSDTNQFIDMSNKQFDSFYFTLKEKYFPYTDSTYLPLLIFGNKKIDLSEHLNLVIDKKSQITFQDCIILTETFMQYMNEFNITETKEKFIFSQGNLAYYFVNCFIEKPKYLKKLKVNFSNLMNKINDKDWDRVENLFLNAFPYDIEDKKYWLNHFRLKYILDTKSHTKNKLKI